jgi:hypothetical protein
LLLMATSRLFQLNCFACWKMPLLEIHIYTYNFLFLFCVMWYVWSKQSLFLSWLLKFPLYFSNLLNNLTILLCFVYLKFLFIAIFQTLRKYWNAQIQRIIS